MSNVGWKSLPVSDEPKMWHVGVGKHLDAVGSLSMPSFMLHFPPKYAYASLGLNAFSSRHSCPLRCSLDTPVLVRFWVLNATYLVYILSTHSRPSIVQEKENIALESQCSWFWEVLEALLCMQPDVHVLGRVIYTHHGAAMLHYWPYEDCIVKELGNGVIKVNATWKIAILTSLLWVERCAGVHGRGFHSCLFALPDLGSATTPVCSKGLVHQHQYFSLPQ